jgi:hypothetical protein
MPRNRVFLSHAAGVFQCRRGDGSIRFVLRVPESAWLAAGPGGRSPDIRPVGTALALKKHWVNRNRQQGS